APETVKQAVIAAMRDEPWNRYPPLAPTDLLERLAARHGWVADGVLIGNGSNELIQATLAVTVGAGTPVVTPVPTFSLYRLLAAVLGGRHVPVPLTADFQFDLDALVGAARTHGRAPPRPARSPRRSCLTAWAGWRAPRRGRRSTRLTAWRSAPARCGAAETCSRADSRGSRVCAPFPRPPTLCSSAARRG